jgi:hypothetical protein
MRFYKFSTVTPDQDFINTIGHQRKSRTTILMSVKRLKAEVARRQWHFRLVPIGDNGGV